MKTVTVQASKTYQVIIESGLHTKIVPMLRSVTSASNVAIISDSNVFPLYGESIISALKEAGINVCYYVFPAGEASKNGQTYLNILNFLAENKLTRSDCIMALGGGVVGDITGFAAATYLRGITYIQVPTTLLAMVDSSVGGKTAIDLPAGKNLAGAFYQPSLVLCDIDTLKTLPIDIFRDGCAEVIKYGALFDPKLFTHLSEKGLNFDLESVVSRCVELKRDVVVQDEFDHGDRQKLNLGHTFGHGVEAISNFKISHGKAVAIGMAIAGRTAAKHGFCTQATADMICNIIQFFGLPTATEYSAAELYNSALSDKKRAGSTVNLILPREIGCCDIVPTAVTKIESYIKAGL